jgi:hypothetical protein
VGNNLRLGRIGDGAFVRRIVLFFLLHCVLESADAVSDSLAEFGEFPGSEDEQSDPENYQQMHGLKQSFKHNFFSLTNDGGNNGGAM